MKKLLAVLISIFMVMSLLAACAPDTPQEDTPMEDESPLDDGMDDMNDDPLNEENPDNNDGSKGLNEEELAMNDNSTEAFKILDDVLTETNNKGYFEVA